MKKILFILLVLISCYSCKKEDVEYINYDSEIFEGNDTLIYGEWKYLYSIGGIAVHKIDKGMSILSIKPIGNYAAISKENDIVQGKILVIGQEYNHTEIQFCKDGIKPSLGLSQTLYFYGTDTLVLRDPCCDLYSDYYKRIK